MMNFITGPVFGGITYSRESAGGGDLTNWALSSNGGTASQSSNATPYLTAGKANNGYRHTNNVWASDVPDSDGSGAEMNPSPTPVFWQVEFPGPKDIQRVNVFTLADAVQYNADPSPSDTFTFYGVSNYKIQYWNGSSFTDIATITGNNLVWRQTDFSPVNTTIIRIEITSGERRLVEVETLGV